MLICSCRRTRSWARVGSLKSNSLLSDQEAVAYKWLQGLALTDIKALSFEVDLLCESPAPAS